MLPEGHVEEHFANMEVQRRAARLGMWAFLATEILLFAGLFAAYAEYRALFHQAFVLGARHLDATMATVETAALLTGSFGVVLAHPSPHTLKTRVDIPQPLGAADDRPAILSLP